MVTTFETYKERLCEMYKKFYGEGAGCPHYAECSANMDPCKFRFDYGARVGENYGCGDVPRVVIMGKEGTSGHTDIEVPATSIRATNNEHYRKTLYTLAMILKGEQPVGFSADDLEPYEYLLTQYCLTNYFKCAFAEQAEQVYDLDHSKAMKENCGVLVVEELKVLEPDLFVVQGKFTIRSFWNALNAAFGVGECVWSNDEKNIELYRHERGGRPLYVLYSYHPSAFGPWSRTLGDLKAAIDCFNEAFEQAKRAR